MKKKATPTKTKKKVEKKAVKKSAKKSVKKAAKKTAKKVANKSVKKVAKKAGPVKKAKPVVSAYDAKRNTEAQKQREQSASVRDIGEIPPPLNPVRREAGRMDLKTFLETYFKAAFPLEWSRDHLRAIAAIQQAVDKRVKIQVILPRAFGKTTLGIAACIWAAIYGHSEYVVLIAATGELATDLLETVKTILDTNQILHEDFPEFTVPIRALEGMPNRCSGQTYKGVSTRIKYSKDRIVFAYLGEAYPDTGGVFRVGALSGKAMRGFNHTKPNGVVIRPSFFLADDPQTDDSARSFIQTTKRLRLLVANIGCMCGPTEAIGGVMACTVIEADDLTCRIMIGEETFEWLHIKAAMVYEWPDKSGSSMWEEYRVIFVACYKKAQDKLDEGGDIEDLLEALDLSPATEYYRENRASMDNGCRVAWASRYVEQLGEISAIQHVHNLKFRLGDEVFEKEYQNNPQPHQEAGEALTREDVLGDPNDRINYPGLIIQNQKRGMIPATADHLVCYVDVHKKVLFYTVVAFERDGFQSHLIDYGVYPPQNDRVFRMSAIKVGMRTIHKGSEDAAMLAGLRMCIDTGGKVRGHTIRPLCGTPYRRIDGAEMFIEACPIDTGYKKDVVEKFIRTSPNKCLYPVKGVGFRKSPFDELPKRKGRYIGDHWYITPPGGNEHLRLLMYDTDHFKTHTLARLKTKPGDRGAVTLFGGTRKEHELIVRHWTDGEYFKTGEKDGVFYMHWEQLPSHPDNHWWDCFVGCHMAANRLGCVHLGEVGPRKKNKKKRRKRISRSLNV